MSIAAGLVGLPNVGKSTLFNALTNSQVPAENYPFCTIDPHAAITSVPDPRIPALQKIYGSQKLIPSSVQFVDIAGLVKGAASGEGLGNQFLSHIKEVDLIIHVLRCFEDPLITYSRDEVDPLIDYEIIVTELMLKDIESLEKRKGKIAQLIKGNKGGPAALKELEQELALIPQLEAALNSNDIKTVQTLVKQTPKHSPLRELLAGKNYMIVANVSEDEIADQAYKNNKNYQKLVQTFGADKVIPISARLEYELSQLSESEAQDMASMMGLEERGLDTIIARTYQNLGLITFFTCGPKEIHAWPIQNGMTIRKAAGEIHSDLEKGFICADIFNYNDLATYGSEAKLKEAGKMRVEGQDYIVKDGDIVHIKFNV